MRSSSGWLAGTLCRFSEGLLAGIARGFIASAVVYVSGALFVELVESAITSRTGDETWRYQLVSTVQEMTEMVGVALFIWALLKFLESRNPILNATVDVSESK